MDYAAKQNDTIARRKPGTGVWLLSRSIFTTWIEAASQTLFCPGIPGAGKTIIASVVIEHLQLSFLKENIGIAYIFCAHNERHKAKSLVACLIKQLVTQLPYLPQEVRELYDLHEKHNTYPQNADLIQVFVHIVSGFSKVFIVIDAIDECQDENDRNIFLLIIQNIKEHAHLFVTSRPIASIEEYFKNDLHEEIKATDEDIMAYVKSEISSESFILSTEISSRPELEMHIVEKIVSKAKGM